ncbi:uncharacterized protein LOC135129811 [Zophobas morio]|uniref:uncharacterized protein LOC135129811 n=1 Tax=Zophobas morio TaxID=2755281 RepID=UPI003083CC05
MNSVSYIKFIVESKPLSEGTKIKLKKVGPHRPGFNLVNTTQAFNTEFYKLSKWLCGCPDRKALFCYICLVTDKTRSGPWIDGVSVGIANFEELKIQVEKHQRSKKHMENSLGYALIGSNIKDRSKEWAAMVINHNERVHEHRYILNKLINCVKDEIDTNFKTKMERIISESSFYVASKETICDELLESVYRVCVDLIHKEIQQTDYVSVEFNEATNSGSLDLVFIIRYELSGQIFERFLKFVKKPEELSSVILQELENLDIDDTPNKLISYSHDGLSLTCAHRIEHEKITTQYACAKFIHSYSHKLDLIIQRAASTFKEVKIFFANLATFAKFFSHQKYIAQLDKAAEKRHLRGTKIKWNFDTQTVFIVSLHKDSINECLNNIIQVETERPIVAKAVALSSLLSDSNFIFWLDFFNKVFPNCDRLFNQLLYHEGFSGMKVLQYLDIFKGHMKSVECSIDLKNQVGDNSPTPTKRQRTENVAIKEEITIDEIDLTRVKQETTDEIITTQLVNCEKKRTEMAKSICSIIINCVEDRFSNIGHLSLAALVQSSFFAKYEVFFPKSEVAEITTLHKLSIETLKNELLTIYNRTELSKIEGAIILLQYMYKNKLTNAFPETFKLLKIICTMPMITCEPDRCFTTLAKVKDAFKKARECRSTDAFVMCSLEKELMLRTPNFNDLVIRDFCQRNNRNCDFEYK